MTSESDPRFPTATEIAFEVFDGADERRRESLFGLGNGVLFVRSCPPEAEAGEYNYPGTYRADCYSRRIVKVNGGSLGHDSLVNLPNWLPLRFRIAGEGEWFSLHDAEILSYRHRLDLSCGITERIVLARDGQGRRFRLREQRLVSMTHSALAALRLEVTPEDWSGRVEFCTGIEGGIENHNTDSRILPGYRHLDITDTGFAGDILSLTAITRQSRITIATAARTVFDPSASGPAESKPDAVLRHVFRDLKARQTLTVEKVAAIVTGHDPATGDPAEAARELAATAPDFATLRDEHARAWGGLWERVGIEAETPSTATGLAFHAFQLLQTVSPHTALIDAGLPSRGWQEAYHGQIFWDEIFAFPFLNHRFPEIARGLLLYRYRRLGKARAAARAAGYAGAMFPWRSGADGAEETPRFQFNPLSGHWMRDHTRLQRHIGAAITHNIWRYYRTTGDEEFLASYGAEMMVEIARFWASIATHDKADDRFDISGVIGPDEYHNAYPGAPSPGLDNNAYTNIMAARSLVLAAEALDLLPPRRQEALARTLGIGGEEPVRWRRIARRLRLCFHGDGIISQFQGFDRLKPFDGKGFAARHPDGRVDWMLEARGDTADAYQVSKQADVLMLLYLFPPDDLIRLISGMDYAMDADCLRRTASYYLDRVTHESSLSHVVCAGALAVLDPVLSWRFFERALCIDFDADNSASAEGGLHLGAMAGTLDVLQRHYFGLDLQGEAIRLTPSIPAELGPVRLRLRHRGRGFILDWDGTALHVRADPENAKTLHLHAGPTSHEIEPGRALTINDAKAKAG